VTATGEQATDGEPVPLAEAQGAQRRIWELSERQVELERAVSESTEREHVRQLELAAALRDVAVKSAQNAMLEDAAVERQQLVEWLQQLLDTERQRSQALELHLAERAVLVDQLRDELAAYEGHLRHERNLAEEAREAARHVQVMLDAERSLLSSRFGARVFRIVRRVPGAGLAWRTCRRVTGRPTTR
jgi:hypothetical protein